MTTKTAQFTPGPWKYDGKYIIGQRYVAEQFNWHITGEGGQYEEQNAILRQEQAANGSLIAAAPAMYEALKALVDVFPSVVKMTPYGVSMDISKLHDNAKAALQQAEGRQA